MAKDPQAALLKLIRDAGSNTAEDGTITIRELSKLLECGSDKARGVIGDLIEAGKMEPCRSIRKQITGVSSPTWAYRMVE